MDERERRIVEKAVELAERGGFEGVRQRDVAAQSGVALGTLYKRFKGKDELLVAALNMEMEKLDNRLKRRPVPGDSPLERVENFFEAATQVFVKRPNLGRASIRAVASGEPDIARRLHAYHERIGRGIITALLGSEPPRALTELQMTEAELANLAYMLQQMWFSVLVGWSGGLVEPEVAVSRVAETADLLVRGMQAKKSQDLPQ